jgi:hypothetical protein
MPAYLLSFHTAVAKYSHSQIPIAFAASEHYIFQLFNCSTATNQLNVTLSSFSVKSTIIIIININIFIRTQGTTTTDNKE